MSEEHNFYVQAFYKGGMNGFEVIPNGDSYSIATDGKIIAVLEHRYNNWQQVQGEHLPEEVLVSIYQQIEQKKS